MLFQSIPIIISSSWTCTSRPRPPIIATPPFGISAAAMFIFILIAIPIGIAVSVTVIIPSFLSRRISIAFTSLSIARIENHIISFFRRASTLSILLFTLELRRAPESPLVRVSPALFIRRRSPRIRQF
ncbi:hypothetical protein AA313_de0204796 [Arthrobotrys entomopaga]|nr:hypothetical protein AA313_de0204796 [Arthrobotrys entomopaga]